MLIRDFLKIRGRKVISIGPDKTIREAIESLIENNIGALPICDKNGILIGIISERDLLKECLRQTNSISSTKVGEIMTEEVVVGKPDDDLDYAATVMKKKHIRHLPIVIGQKLESIISIRDIVNTQLEESQTELRYIGLIKKAPSGRTHLR